jgi:nanoRNase/pAp phosphatase (c-di-AMP/oligoRNAs hydrolase)
VKDSRPPGYPEGEQTVAPFPDIAKCLEAHRGERHAIILHAFPDPDAIAAAYTHRLISARYDIETAIFYSG